MDTRRNFRSSSSLTDSPVVFQLGQQNRQVNSYQKARDIIQKGLLGKISLIETSTSRNDDNGAWVYPINSQTNEHTVDWQAFCPDPRRRVEFNAYMQSHKLQMHMVPLMQSISFAGVAGGNIVPDLSAIFLRMNTMR